MLSLKLDTSHEDILYFSTNGPGNKFNIFHIRALEEYLILRGGAVKSLARTTSRCRRTESIVSSAVNIIHLGYKTNQFML